MKLFFDPCCIFILRFFTTLVLRHLRVMCSFKNITINRNAEGVCETLVSLQNRLQFRLQRVESRQSLSPS